MAMRTRPMPGALAAALGYRLARCLGRPGRRTRGAAPRDIRNSPLKARRERQPFATVPYSVHLNDIASFDFSAFNPAAYEQQLTVLYPSASGETSDALMAYLPASGVLFTGDVMMPYLGAPFFAEGSPDGLIETLKFITGLRPRQLVHGHTTLTELFTTDAAAGLLPALSELHEHALAGISAGKTLTGLLEANLLPEVLREHPAAVGPYLVTRDHFLQRLHHQHTGYWHNDGQGLEPVSAAQRAAALDLLAGGKPEPFADAAKALLAQRDHALALEIATAGLASHPGAAGLTQLRQQALYRLMERHQLQDPFRFLIYAEMAGAEIGPAA